MANENKEVARLQKIIDTSYDAKTVELAKKQLQRLQSVGTAQLQTADASGDSTLDNILNALKTAMSFQPGVAVDVDEIRNLVLTELSKRKISETDLSPSLQAILQTNRLPVTLNVVNKMTGVKLTKQVSSAMLNRKLTQLILSDIVARNNTYLYGGAGTGKTYIAEEIAELLGWEKITLNCNQFTSPLDILGGQTIEGYQEGKLSMAWSNVIINPDGTKKKVPGVVLILDELPKIDPNTAGILNEALAKIKDFKYNDVTGENDIPPTIRNGKNEILPLGNLFVIATGNVPLNTTDPDYEANFKQDLSLQDRFVGSTYRVKVDYKYESTVIMKGFLFIWLYLEKVRTKIAELRAGGQAFVSMRLMINAKATYIAYRQILANQAGAKGNVSADAIKNPKTLEETIEAFFDLFKPSIKDALMSDTNYEDFKKIIAQKNSMKWDAANPDFDTDDEKKMAELAVEYNEKNG